MTATANDKRDLTVEPRWTREDVAAYFGCSRTSTYKIRGLEQCRAKVPGTRLVRFVPAMVRALGQPVKRSA